MSNPTTLSPIILLTTLAAHARNGLTENAVLAAELQGNSAVVKTSAGTRVLLQQGQWRHATPEEASTLNRTEPAPEPAPAPTGEEPAGVWDEEKGAFVDPEGNEVVVGNPVGPETDGGPNPHYIDPASPRTPEEQRAYEGLPPLERTPDGETVLVPSTDAAPHAKPVTDQTNDEAVAEAEADQAEERSEFEASQANAAEQNAAHSTSKEQLDEVFNTPTPEGEGRRLDDAELEALFPGISTPTPAEDLPPGVRHTTPEENAAIERGEVEETAEEREEREVNDQARATADLQNRLAEYDEDL